MAEKTHTKKICTDSCPHIQDFKTSHRLIALLKEERYIDYGYEIGGRDGKYGGNDIYHYLVLKKAI